MAERRKPISFEQAFLAKAFTHSLNDEVENTDQVIRALKGVLVQKKTREKFENTEEMMARLNELEEHPLPGVKKDIYGVCKWLRTETDHVVIWHDGLPVKRIGSTEIRAEMRGIMDELNEIGGYLCEVLEIPMFDMEAMFRKRNVSFPVGRRVQDEA